MELHVTLLYKYQQERKRQVLRSVRNSMQNFTKTIIL